MLPQTPIAAEEADWLIPPGDGGLPCDETDLDTLADVLAAILARLLAHSGAARAAEPGPAQPGPSFPN